LVERLSTRVLLELAGAGRDDEAMARATWSLERASERGGQGGSVKPNRYVG
jgi:hypothetical protein